MSATHPVKLFPQLRAVPKASVTTKVTLAAYEVYAHAFGPQEQLITGDCRGGFSAGELIALLYARSFPKKEWKARADEAYENMKGL